MGNHEVEQQTLPAPQVQPTKLFVDISYLETAIARERVNLAAMHYSSSFSETISNALGRIQIAAGLLTTHHNLTQPNLERHSKYINWFKEDSEKMILDARKDLTAFQENVFGRFRLMRSYILDIKKYVPENIQEYLTQLDQFLFNVLDRALAYDASQTNVNAFQFKV